MLPSPPRAARALTVVLCAALLCAALPAALFPGATAAHAADRTVRGGRLDWAVKSSFQTYVTGPVAQGSWNLAGGAATTGGGQFRFHSAQGTYDPATGAFSAAFSGGVRFLGHREADGTHRLDLTISRPRVRIAAGRGTLYADMTSRGKDTGRLTSTAQVPLAALDLGGIDMRGGTTPVGLTTVPATLTAEGARAFAGYYPAGTALDPVTLSADVHAPASAKPAPTPPPATTSSPPPAPGTFRDAAVDWGVRRTFREYVTGPVAKGKWTLADGARDGGALFRFPRGTGTYDPAGPALTAAFTGGVRFTGDHLDLTLARPTVRVQGGRGTLSADVTSAGTTTRAVPLVTFDARGLIPEQGLATLTETPTTLTARGAQAFGGMYREGTAMDPLSLAVALDAGARLPALPDLGSEPVTPATGTPPAPTPTTTAAAAPGPSTGVYATAGAALLVAAAAAATYAVRRRTTGATADKAATGDIH
ncbi:HtaA domain-containing protein [Streptomyces coeruleoprunus]|uniref:HtaA domain-containing protein n=1 Tax=Streptomyces coeruleoprunus TaxID=285563 RepID=UPI0035E512A3